MKIELDLMTVTGISILSQMQAVDEYIKQYSESSKHKYITGVEYYEYNIELTGKHEGFDVGQKISVGNMSFHVSCKKTQSGTYKFNVWRA